MSTFMKKHLKLLLMLVIFALGVSTLYACAPTACTNHIDANGDDVCDTCGEPITPDEPCTEHTDADGDDVCDTCGVPITIEADPNVFVPVVRFIASSDVHISTATSIGAKRLQTAIEQLSRYAADTQRNDGYAALDALLLAGDITNGGTSAQFRAAKDYFKDTIPKGTRLVMTMGNHDWNGYGADARGEFEKVFGKSMTDTVIGGYHFITIVDDAERGSRGYGWDYSQETLQRAEQLIQAAIADTGTDKPVFVIQHIGNVGTAVGTGPESESASHCSINTLQQMQSKYPNLVVFSGHSHFAINDECSIHQKDFTSINTGSLTSGMGMLNNGKYMPMDSSATVESVYLVEVDAQGHTRIRVWNTATEDFMGEEWMLTSYQKDDFIYTEDRFSQEDIFFATDATVTAEQITKNSATLTFLPTPAQSLPGRVYRVIVKNAAGAVVSTSYLCPEYYTDDFETPLSIRLLNLSPATTYTAELCALNPLYSASISSYEQMLISDALTVNFTTSENTSSLTPDYGDKTLPAGDLIALKIDRANELLVNGVSGGMGPNLVGAPVIDRDESIGMNTVSFKNEKGAVANAVRFDTYAAIGADIIDSFTFELYFKADADSYGSYGCPASSEQSGGFGLELYKDGRKLAFSLKDSSKWQVLNATYELDVYYHVVVTLDGTNAVLYINGVKVDELTLTSALVLPPETSQFICLGCDVQHGEHQTPIDCTIAGFNLYSDALTSEQVAANFALYSSK